jgi:hypothetical protein
MHLVDGNDENGTFSITDHTYVVTNSQLTYFDYPTTQGLTVGHYISLLIQYRRHAYRMTNEGNGCRFWVRIISRTHLCSY